MRHQKSGRKFHRKKGQRKALFKGLLNNLITKEKILTTEAKAKAIKPIVEKFITRSKTDTLSNRRVILSRLPIKKATKKLFEVLGPRYASRKGGYLRIIKLPTRLGDGAAMVQIELV